MLSLSVSVCVHAFCLSVSIFARYHECWRLSRLQNAVWRSEEDEKHSNNIGHPSEFQPFSLASAAIRYNSTFTQHTFSEFTIDYDERGGCYWCMLAIRIYTCLWLIILVNFSFLSWFVGYWLLFWLSFDLFLALLCDFMQRQRQQKHSIASMPFNSGGQ